jgi:hypothetical protein
MGDATWILHEFACRYASEALQRERAAGREPHPSAWVAIQAKRDWLDGKINRAELDKACCETRYRACYDGCGEDRYEACEAAYQAARYEACEAAHGAAYHAACHMAHGAAYDVACGMQDQLLSQMVETLM